MSIIIKDGLKNSNVQIRENVYGAVVWMSCDRTFYVTNIPVGNMTGNGTATSETVSTQAIAAVQNVVPYWTPHPDNTPTVGSEFPFSVMVSREYYFYPLESGFDGMVVIRYIYEPTPQVYTVELRCWSEQVDCDTEISGNTTIPISVAYHPNWTDQQHETDTEVVYGYGRGTAFKTRKTWTYSCPVSSTVANSIKNNSDLYQNTINSSTFNGADAGTVYCSEYNVSFNPTINQFFVSMVFIYKPEGWGVWTHYEHPVLGTPANIWHTFIDHEVVGNTTYPPGADNGFHLTQQYYSSDHNAAVAQIPH